MSKVAKPVIGGIIYNINSNTYWVIKEIIHDYQVRLTMKRNGRVANNLMGDYTFNLEAIALPWIYMPNGDIKTLDIYTLRKQSNKYEL